MVWPVQRGAFQFMRRSMRSKAREEFGGEYDRQLCSRTLIKSVEMHCLQPSDFRSKSIFPLPDPIRAGGLVAQSFDYLYQAA